MDSYGYYIPPTLKAGIGDIQKVKRFKRKTWLIHCPLRCHHKYLDFA
jgi:hypothetical protein